MKKKLGILIVCLSLCGCGTVKRTVNIINDAKESAKERTAELIISQVDLAYTQAMYSSNGSYPTLEQVKNEFSSDSAYWEEDKIYSYGLYEFVCDINVENLRLKVTCLNSETKNELVLSE